MKKLLKKAAIWYARNYRLNTPVKIFKHLSKYYYDYDPHLCTSMYELYRKRLIKVKVYNLSIDRLQFYLINYANDFRGKQKPRNGYFWEDSNCIDTIENKKKFLRYIAEKEGKK